MPQEYFEIKPEHLKLLKRSYWGWEDCEFGAPAMDCKRPYGNSDVHTDIAEILGESPEDDDEYTDEQRDRFNDLHTDMENVLQIVCRELSFETGVFYREASYKPWVKVVDRS